jgi:hypothetical protein
MAKMFHSLNPSIPNFIPASPTKMFLILGGFYREKKVDLVPEDPSTLNMFHELSPFPRDVVFAAAGMLKPGNIIITFVWDKDCGRLVVIDRKRFRPSIRPKIIGRIFGRNEYSASAAENEKSLV